jgi:hypothetical protein
MKKALTKPPLLVQILTVGRSQKLVFPTDGTHRAGDRRDEDADAVTELGALTGTICDEDVVTELDAIDAEVNARLSRRTARTGSSERGTSATLGSRSQQRKRSSAVNGRTPLRRASSARQGTAGTQRVSEAAAGRTKIRAAGFFVGDEAMRRKTPAERKGVAGREQGGMRRAKSQKITKRRNTSASASGVEYNMKVRLIYNIYMHYT